MCVFYASDQLITLRNMKIAMGKRWTQNIKYAASDVAAAEPKLSICLTLFQEAFMCNDHLAYFEVLEWRMHGCNHILKKQIKENEKEKKLFFRSQIECSLTEWILFHFSTEMMMKKKKLSSVLPFQTLAVISMFFPFWKRTHRYYLSLHLCFCYSSLQLLLLLLLL